ncbi:MULTISPECIES: hypothetical protein [Klebsiella pneumoniae complex]|jgi:NADH:ubiquinone oxidoreductase subunit K|uniref:hypothetical protein n=1 Tax=Klebsiella pneumoniae complex TaxID=3390273 RepID=UPI0003880000|nr:MULTISPECIES: hypothetical protein [Klebsiella]AGT25526.1 hypothetical protein N559_3890 [Klebsiella pneumoniae JM45]DAP84840.1 MAG TPA: Mitochondrial morphogenesis regulator [Bacteriophage sp.]HDT4206895.1 hypothetical protein [Klebsiella pneumoniae subsp. pneumoniae]MCJ6019746.1 hypothetical protein [Klebsiella pneumoniae]MDD1104098.1 hypothetical protein [Klebsiella pneumoniae]
MAEVIVKTKEELEKAKDDKVEYIVIEGELADKVRKSKTVAKASGAALAIIAAAIAAAPVTGGLSSFAVAPVAAMSGFEIAAIIAAASIGLALIIALFKDYEEIEAGEGKIKLKRRQKN